jgi:hypothetical protein
MQNIIYFLQEAKGVPLNYDFYFYNYAPYSPRLSTDFEYASFLGIVSLEPTTENYIVRPGKTSEREQSFLKRHKSKIKQVISDFGMLPAKDLETRAVLYYCHRFAYDRGQLLSQEEIISQVQKLKPRLSLSIINTAAAELYEKNYIKAAPKGGKR